MSDDSARIVSRRWSYCQVLRGDGLSYQDYLEQLTALLFLKMAEEQEGLTGEEQTVPQGYRWSDLAAPNWKRTISRRCACLASRAACSDCRAPPSTTSPGSYSYACPGR